MDELQKLQELEYTLRHINKAGTHRCSICNTTNTSDIETNIGDFKGNISFVDDPKNSLHVICVQCAEEIEDLRRDYEFMDEEDEAIF